jgi:hypothetical protein
MVQPGRYRHYKGHEYEVLGVARHSETEEENMWSIARATATVGCGSDQRRCSWNGSSSTDN